MEALLEFGLEATRYLQETFPYLASFFQFISELGTEEAYLLMLPLIYWCLHKGWGRHFAYLFLLSNFVNFFMKQAFRTPRPFWLEPELNIGGESTSFGIPSGHTQTATVIGLFFAYKIKKRWMWWLAGIYIVLMMISRVFVGHHFVHDVVLGLLMGMPLFGGYWLWMRQWYKQFKQRILGFRLMVALLIPTVLALVYTAVFTLLPEPSLTSPYADLIELAERDSLDGIVTTLASLLGTGIGLSLEKSRVRFRVDGPIWQRALRFLLGMAVAGAIWAGLGELFPDEPLAVAIPLRVLRYALLTLWITYYAPATFVLLRLASADPEPEISLKIE